MAAYTTRTGLCQVIMEGKDLVTRTTKEMIVLAGQDFVNFEFLGAVRAPLMQIKKPVTIAPMILGARLISRSDKYTVFISGRMVSETLSDAEIKHYEGLRR